MKTTQDKLIQIAEELWSISLRLRELQYTESTKIEDLTRAHLAKCCLFMVEHALNALSVV